MKSKIITLEEDLKTAFAIRKAVFVEEQGVPLEDEFDEFDVLGGPCEHILVYHDEKPVGTGRVRVVADFAKLERICVLKPYRKYGLGKTIIKALEDIAAQKGMRRLKLHGQTQAQGFYEKLGYRTASDEFIEDGIPHVLLVKNL